MRPPRPDAPDADPSAFADLPVRRIAFGDGQFVAVHQSGLASATAPPLVCLAGYHRNMSDFKDLLSALPKLGAADTPILLVDLKGRGRSSHRRDPERYTTVNDAHDVGTVLTALGVSRAILLGQGHGGQAAMALAAMRPSLFAGAVLIDAGPIADPRGLVRMRHNLAHLAAVRGEAQALATRRQVLAPDFPGLTPAEVDEIAARTHVLDARQRLRPLFDPALGTRLARFDPDDVFVSQWPLFTMLWDTPMLLMRTQLTDQLRPETFEEMARQRPDAVTITISGQGSPALLKDANEVGSLVDFVRHVARSEAR